MAREWERVKIGDLLDFKNGLNKGKQFFGQGTPIVNYTDVYKKRGLKKSDIKGTVTLDDNEIKRYEVKKGDVFFTRTSETPEEVGIASVLLDDIPNCAFSGFVLRGRPKTDRLVPEYCKYCFSTQEVRREIITRCTYTTRALTNGKQLSAIDIPVPEKAEQRAIAMVLSEIDELIENLRTLIEKKKNIRQGAIQQLISGKRRLPGFEAEWKEYNLGKECRIYGGGTPSTKNSSYWIGTIPWVSSSDLIEGDIFHLSETRYITTDAISESATQLCPPNCILVVSRVGVGKIAVCDHEVCTSQDFTNIYLEKHNPVFVAYKLLPAMKELAITAQGTSIKGVSSDDIKAISLLLPEADEQDAVVALLKDMDSEIHQLQMTLGKYINIRSGMMDELLTGKIRLV